MDTNWHITVITVIMLSPFVSTGENRVISALEMLGNQSIFGGQQEDPMFIICGYQYNNYLNKLREDMFSKDDATRPARAFGQTMRAEHDCLIFHKVHFIIYYPQG